MSELISRQVLDLWDRYKPTIAVDAIEYDRELKQLLSTNLAEVGTDLISRKAAINAIDECYCGGEDSCGEPWVYRENAVEAIQMIEPILPETAKRIIGKSRGGMTLWYQCNVCNEPVDEKDAYCRGCGRRLIDG